MPQHDVAALNPGLGGAALRFLNDQPAGDAGRKRVGGA